MSCTTTFFIPGEIILCSSWIGNWMGARASLVHLRQRKISCPGRKSKEDSSILQPIVSSLHQLSCEDSSLFKRVSQNWINLLRWLYHMITVVRAFSCNSVTFLQHAIHLQNYHDGFRVAWYFLGWNAINILVEVLEEIYIHLTFAVHRPSRLWCVNVALHDSYRCFGTAYRFHLQGSNSLRRIFQEESDYCVLVILLEPWNCDL